MSIRNPALVIPAEPGIQAFQSRETRDWTRDFAEVTDRLLATLLCGAVLSKGLQPDKLRRFHKKIYFRRAVMVKGRVLEMYGRLKGRLLLAWLASAGYRF